jgi:hypothetical protein
MFPMTNAQQTTAQPLPEYPCDICGEHIQAGEKFSHDPKGETTHNDCARNWFRGL